MIKTKFSITANLSAKFADRMISLMKRFTWMISVLSWCPIGLVSCIHSCLMLNFYCILEYRLCVNKLNLLL